MFFLRPATILGRRDNDVVLGGQWLTMEGIRSLVSFAGVVFKNDLFFFCDSCLWPALIFSERETLLRVLYVSSCKEASPER